MYINSDEALGEVRLVRVGLGQCAVEFGRGTLAGQGYLILELSIPEKIQG